MDSPIFVMLDEDYYQNNVFDSNKEIPIRPELFYFLFNRPSRLNFLKIEKKKTFFFQFYFCFFLRLMSVQY